MSNNKNKVNYNSQKDNNSNQLKVESDNEIVEHVTYANTEETVELALDQDNKELDNDNIQEEATECINNTIIAQEIKEEPINNFNLDYRAKEENELLNKIAYNKSLLKSTRNEITKAICLGEIKKAEAELEKMHKDPTVTKAVETASLISERTIDHEVTSRFGSRGQVMGDNNLFTVTW